MSDAATPRRVLFVQTATSPVLGADAWVLLRVMEPLDRSSHDVFVACRKTVDGRPTPVGAEVAELADVHVVDCDLGPELSGRSFVEKVVATVRTMAAARSLLRLARLVRRERIQVVHSGDRPRDALAATLLGRWTGAVSVVHVNQAYNAWWTRLLRWSVRRADVVVPVSQFVGASLVDGGVDPSRVAPVLNAVDVDRWVPGEGRREVRAELGLADDTPLVLAVCRLFPEKGVAELLRAFALVRRRVAGARLAVAGNDLSPGGAYSAELRRLANDLGVGDAVHFLGRRDDVPRLMAAADVFALPSRGEPFGLVYIEAMAMCLPPVALADGGPLEIVEHGETGLLARPGDIEGLAEHLVTLLCDAELRDRMGRRGRAVVEASFTLERQADAMAEVYRSALAGPDPGRRA